MIIGLGLIMLKMECDSNKEEISSIGFYNTGTLVVININNEWYSVSWMHRMILGLFQLIGYILTGIKDINDSLVFHAGTTFTNNKVVTNGGRVIAVTSFGNSKNEALVKSYNNADKINFDKKYFRTDIGFDI